MPSISNSEENGVTDYVIANAGTSCPGYFLETSIETLEKEVNLNYLGTVYTIKAALPFMVDRNQGGHFVIVSSAGTIAWLFKEPFSCLWKLYRL